MEILGTVIMVVVILAIIGTILFAIGKSSGGLTASAAILLIALVIWLNDIIRPNKKLVLPERIKDAIKEHI